jgi:hypothetical protein
MFVKYEDYMEYGSNVLSEDEAYTYLNKSERQINALCQNRIFDNSIFKYMSSTQNLVKQIICEHAEYLYQNKDEIEKGVIKSYSNNGASITYDNNNSIVNKFGTTIKSDLYNQLVLTGLCYRGIL